MLSTHPWSPSASSSALPLVAEPATPGGDNSAAALTSWLGEHAGWLPDRLRETGAVLFRGFGFKAATDFQAFTQARSQGLHSYVGGDSPRTKVRSGVYTSTEYPPEQPIALHSEMSYLPRWPSRLFFFCETAPARGGETPIASSRRVLARIDPEVRRALTERRIMYVQNLHGGRGLGKSWQQVFETTDRGEVERFCQEQGLAFEWKANGGLRTRLVLPATARHPVTGDEVWFNQADQWHTSGLDPIERKMLLKKIPESDLPKSATFGDGGAIPDAMMDDVRKAANQEAIVFPWQRGDVLVIDNMLVSHGRKPFSGPRRILVSMD
jgi:alpha-ketoglutarate-dependent taurine dioxygenase